MPAGESLAVDREAFSKKVTHTLENVETIDIIHKEACALPQDKMTIIATGPLTSEALSQEIQKLTGSETSPTFDA